MAKLVSISFSDSSIEIFQGLLLLLLLFPEVLEGVVVVVVVVDKVIIVVWSPDEVVEGELAKDGMSLLLLARYWIKRDKILLGAWLW